MNRAMTEDPPEGVDGIQVGGTLTVGKLVQLETTI
jgi:hypothetical protein